MSDQPNPPPPPKQNPFMRAVRKNTQPQNLPTSNSPALNPFTSLPSINIFPTVPPNNPNPPNNPPVQNQPGNISSVNIFQNSSRNNPQPPNIPPNPPQKNLPRQNPQNRNNVFSLVQRPVVHQQQAAQIPMPPQPSIPFIIRRQMLVDPEQKGTYPKSNEFKKQVKMNGLNGEIEVVNIQQISREFKIKISHEFLMKRVKGQEIMSFLQRFNITNSNAAISKNLVAQQSSGIKERLALGVTFYSKKAKFSGLASKFDPSQLLKDEFRRTLLLQVGEFTNPLCSCYAIENVLHYHHKVSFKKFMDPTWSNLNDYQIDQNEFWINCYMFLLADLNEYLAIFMDKMEKQVHRNQMILENESLMKEFNQILDFQNYILLTQYPQAIKRGISKAYLSYQISSTLLKIVLISLTFLSSHLLRKEQYHSAKNVIELNLLKFVKIYQENFTFFETLKKHSLHATNIIVQKKVPQKIQQFINQKNLKDIDLLGDWPNLIRFIFSSYPEQTLMPDEREEALLSIYHSIENIEELKQDVWMNPILKKINAFVESLKKTPENVANYRHDLLIFLILTNMQFNIIFPHVQLTEEDQENLDQTLIRRENQKNQKIRQLSSGFNLLSRTILELRKDLAPLVIFQCYTVQQKKYFEIKKDLISGLIKPWMDEPEKYHDEASFLLKRRLFGEQDDLQLLEKDPILIICLQAFQRKFGQYKHMTPWFTLHVLEIFLCWASTILDDIKNRSMGSNLPEIGMNLKAIMQKINHRQENIKKRKKSQNSNKIQIHQMLLEQFTESKQKNKLHPFYVHFLNKAQSNVTFATIIQIFPIKVRRKLIQCLGYKIQNRLMRYFLKKVKLSKENDPLYSLEKQTPSRQYCNKIFQNQNCQFIENLIAVQRRWQREKNQIDQKDKKEISNQSQSIQRYNQTQQAIRNIEPFGMNQLEELEKQIFYDQYLCIINCLTTFKYFWTNLIINPCFLVKRILSNNQTKFVFPSQQNPVTIDSDQANTFSYQFEYALRGASLAIQETIFLLQKNIDQKIFLSALNNIDTVLTHNLNVNHGIETLLDFMIHMRQVEAIDKVNKAPQNPVNRKEPVYNLSQLSVYRIVDYSLFFSQFLEGIAEYIRHKMTLKKARIQISQLILTDSINLSGAQIEQHKSNITFQEKELSDLWSISQKLIVLVGHIIESQHKQHPKDMNDLVMVTLFFIRDCPENFEAKLNMISLFAHLNPTIATLKQLLTEDSKVLKIYRYIKFCQQFNGELLVNPQTKQIMIVKTKEPDPLKVIEDIQSKIQQLVFETANHYLPLLYRKLNELQQDTFLKIFKISTHDLLSISSILKCTITVVKGRLLLQLQQKRRFSQEEKDNMVKLFVINTKIIEVCYQKLLQVVTFERLPSRHINLFEDDWKEYESLLYTIQDFKKLVETVHANKYQHESENSILSVLKSLTYLKEVLQHCELEAGRYYRRLNDRLEKKEKPKLKIYDFLADEPKGMKHPTHNLHKKQDQIDFNDPLVIGRKFQFEL